MIMTIPMRFPLSDPEQNTLIIKPEAAWSRLMASRGKYIIFIDDGGIPIVGGNVGSVDDEVEFLDRMNERWYKGE
jgi:hypothetical protein